MLKVVVLFLVCRNRRKKKKMYASYYGGDSRTGSTKSPTVMYIIIRVDIQTKWKKYQEQFLKKKKKKERARIETYSILASLHASLIQHVSESILLLPCLTSSGASNPRGVIFCLLLSCSCFSSSFFLKCTS